MQPSIKAIAAKIWRRAVLPKVLHTAVNRNKESFTCPNCDFYGPFRNYRPGTGIRLHAQCPSCGALERHRVQRAVLDRLFIDISPQKLRVLHFAPETFFRNHFRRLNVKSYETADLHMTNVDHQVDLCDLPFPDGSYDLVFASHVLEHIDDDIKAISEISRILSKGGVAILPVPIVGKISVEYDKPNPLEEYHVRAPGEDYFERYKPYFSEVNIIKSSELNEGIQPFIYEDRSGWPDSKYPQRIASGGERHEDFIPICIR